MDGRFKRTLGNNVIWNFFGAMFYMGCQWLMTVLVVRLTGGYYDAGILSLAMSVTTPLTSLANRNMRTVQVADIDGRYHDIDYFATRFVSSAAALICCVLFVLWRRYEVYTAACVIIFMVYRISEAVVDVLHGIDQRAWRLDIAGRSYIMRGLVLLLGCVIGECVFKSLLAVILLVAAGVYVVVFLYDVPRAGKYMDKIRHSSKNRVFGLLKIGFPLCAYAILLNAMASIPRFFLENWYGEEILGIYASLATISILIPQTTTLIYSPLVPIFSERFKNRDRKGFSKLLWVCALFTLLVGAAAVGLSHLCGEWVLVLAFGESIRPYSHLFVPIMFSAVLIAVSWLLCSVLMVLEDYNALAVLTAVSVAVCIAASALIIREGGLWGTMAAFVIGMAAECVLLSARLWMRMKRLMSSEKS